MSGEFDALGDLATAGLAARTLDKPGRRRGAHRGPADDINAAEIANAHHVCANCEAALGGNFCANCGQQAHVHRSLLHVGEEFLHGITHFDGKAWQTLPMLVFRPGRLTRNYIEGKRARYIAPVPLFLLVVFLMFFVFSFVHIKANPGVEVDGKPMSPAAAAQELPRIESQLAELDTKLAAARKAGNSVEAGALEGVRAGVVAARDKVAARARGEIDTPLDVPEAIRASAEAGETTINLGDATLNEKAKKALKNPDLVFYKIQGKAYKFSFLLVPLSLPWLWLVFAWKRGVRLYDHAVFALYSISFMSLLFIIGSIALSLDVVDGGLFGGLLLAAIVHMFLQLKGTYALSGFSAAWRTAALSGAAFITLSIYAVLMIVLGVID